MVLQPGTINELVVVLIPVPREAAEFSLYFSSPCSDIRAMMAGGGKA